MVDQSAIVRQEVMGLTGVTGTWIEWESKGDSYSKILVIEVDWDTDPNSDNFKKNNLESIDQEVAHVLANKTTMVIGGVRIIPKRRP